MTTCTCHCHQEIEQMKRNGIQCRCIKNCVHCNPENFKQSWEGEVEGRGEENGWLAATVSWERKKNY